MKDWDQIQRNARKTGSFAGATGQEQDEYFAFFANDRPRFFRPFKIGAGKLWSR